MLKPTVIFACTTALAVSACNRSAPAAEEEAPQGRTAQWAEGGASEIETKVEVLNSEIEALEARVEYLEDVAVQAKMRADEAHDLAEEARDQAELACKPMGYQYGCGNSP